MLESVSSRAALKNSDFWLCLSLTSGHRAVVWGEKTKNPQPAKEETECRKGMWKLRYVVSSPNLSISHYYSFPTEQRQNVDSNGQNGQ